MYFPQKMDTAQTRCDLHGRAASGGSAWQENACRTDPVWKHTGGSAACAEALPQVVELILKYPVQLAWKSCLMWFGLAGLLPRGNYDTYDITAMHAAQTRYGSIPTEVRLVWKSSLRWFGLAGGVATDPVWKHTRGSVACAEELPQGVWLSRVVEPTPKCISPGKWILHRPAVACVKELPWVVQLGRFIAYG
ncbi:hypothetical protein BKA83DRAFT_4124141 [Pisolithus microcarpus]|nr:hypothetical protein BKA83DRAFT_4124141 [Pisolithus microcarpus]